MDCSLLARRQRHFRWAVGALSLVSSAVTGATLHEYVMPRSLFPDGAPVVGHYYTGPSGGTVFQVAKVRNIAGGPEPTYRLIGARIRRRDMPDGIEVRPWPRPSVGRPRKRVAAMPPTPTPIQTLSQRQAAERKRILAHNRMLRDSTQVVEPIRLAGDGVVAADWRDPEDNNPNRRTAKVIHGFRARDQVDILVENGTFNRNQAYAAKRFRTLYELGEVGLKASPNLLEAKVGFESSGGPSEQRLMWLQAYRQMCQALRPGNVRVLLAIVIGGQRVKDYAARERMRPTFASGVLLGAVQFLADYFKEQDDARVQEQQSPATIGSQTGQSGA